MTGAEFLALERGAATKHEFINGEVHDMAGGTPTHALIGANVTRELGMRLGGRGCNPYSSDLRIKVEETGLHTYPDVSVVCGELEFADGERDTVTNPVLLVEVLSPSTEAYDRGGKFAHYRRMPSLQAYLLADPFTPRLELFIRAGDGFWRLSTAEGLETTLVIEPLGITLAVAEIYRGVKFGPPPPHGAPVQAG